MLTKIVAAVYLCFLLVMVYLADMGTLSDYFSWHKDVPFGDTLGHFILMGTLSFLVNSLLEMRTLRVSSYHVHLGSVLVLFLVIVEECSQLFIASRTFSFLDLLADGLGIFFFGFLAGKMFESKKPSLQTYGDGPG